MIEVTVKCSGHGHQYSEQVILTREDLEQLACAKMREVDASENIQATDVRLKLSV